MHQRNPNLYHTIQGGSPKRLKLNPSQEKFDQFSAAEMMAEGDRYSLAKTMRNNRGSEMRHPPKTMGNPKLSPRRSNKSVDPLTRNKVLLGQSSSNMQGPRGNIGH
jgi:hypothetical protein